jgi:hypothetical protein
MSAEKGSIKMKTRIILLALFPAICLAIPVWAQAPQDPGVYGGFYGIITFHDCHCLNPEERVNIQPASGGTAYLYGVDCGDPQHGNPAGYTTQGRTPQTLFPGSYYIGVFCIRAPIVITASYN